MVFALFNVVWSTLFLEEWKRRGAELAYKWGTLDSPGEAVEEPRPQFRVSRGDLSSGTLRMGLKKRANTLGEEHCENKGRGEVGLQRPRWRAKWGLPMPEGRGVGNWL